MKTLPPTIKKSLLILGIFGITTFITYGATSTGGGLLKSSPYEKRSDEADNILSRLTDGAGATILDGVIKKVVSHAKESGGNPVNKGLYNTYIDKKLSQLDLLDDEITKDPELGSDYAFIFQYIYPRLYEKKLPDNRIDTVLDKVSDVLGTNDEISCPMYSIPNPQDGCKFVPGKTDSKGCSVPRIVCDNTGSIIITTPSTLHPIRSGGAWQYTLASASSTGTPVWSIVSGALPPTMSLDVMKGTIDNYNTFNKSPIEVNNVIAAGTYTFTVKVAIGSEFGLKQFNIKVVPTSDTKPIINFGQKARFAVNELIQGGDGGIVGIYHFYYSPNTENDTCAIIKGQLPTGVIMQSSPNGCMLSGAPTVTGIFHITWKIENQYGSDTAEYLITVFTPETFIKLLYGNSLPDATVGEPYTFTFNVSKNGLSPRELELFRYGTRGGVPSGLILDDKTGVMSGIPNEVGTYDIHTEMGISTFQHLSFGKIVKLTIKPRIQTQEAINADIMKTVNSFSWTEANNVQNALNLKAIMKQNGWTLGDITTATSYKMSDVANLLYPSERERSDKLMAISEEARKIINTFNWSEANKYHSSKNFREIMIQKGIPLEGVLYNYFTLSGYGVERDAIKSIIEDNPLP